MRWVLMKNKRIIYSILLVSTFLFTVLPLKSSFAYSGGLLEGERLHIGSTRFDNTDSTTLLTDNDTVTFVDVLKNKVVWYEFATPQSIGSFVKMHGSVNYNMELYDSNDTLLYTSTNTIRSNTIQSIPVVANVKKVAFVNVWNSTSNRTYEFDVFSGTDNLAPTTPTNLKVESGEGFAQLTWNASAEVDVKGYYIYENGIQKYFIPNDTNKKTITGLLNGNTYDYQISSIDYVNNESPLSVVVQGTPDILFGNILALKSLNYGSTPTTATGVETKLTDLDITSYAPTRSSMYYWHEFPTPVTLGSFEFTATSPLSAYSMTYYDSTGKEKYKTAPANLNGVKVPTPVVGDVKKVALWIDASRVGKEWALFTGVDNTPPSTPTNMVVESGDGYTFLKWNPNAETDIYGYNVYQNGSKTDFVPVDKNYQVISGLSNGVTYNFRIAAIDYAGNESALSAGESTTPDHNTGNLIALKPLHYGSTPTATTGIELMLTDFDRSAYTPARSNMYYWYEFPSPVSLGSYELLGNTTPTSFNIVYYDSAGDVKYTVSSPNITGTRTNTSVVTDVKKVSLWIGNPRLGREWALFPGVDTNAPNAPSNLVVENGDTFAFLTWSPNAESDIYGYNLYQDGKKTDFIPVGTNQKVVESLSNGTTYEYQLTAMDYANNESPLSSVLQVEPKKNTGNLLGLKPLYYGNTPSSTTGVETTLTDFDNTNTNPSRGAATYYWHEFSTPMTLSAYSLKGISTPTSYEIFYYDSLGNEIYRRNSPSTTGTKTNTIVIGDVNKVALWISGSRIANEWAMYEGEDTIPPDEPVGINIESGDTYLSVKWAANSDADFKGYNVYMNGVKQNSSLLLKTLYNAPNLQNETTYKVDITAVDYAGNESTMLTSVGTPKAGKGGLLKLKPLNLSTDVLSTQTTTDLLTDNDDTSYYTIANKNYAWYEFSTPKTINTYRFVGSTFTLYFYDSAGALITSFTPVSGAKKLMPSLTDVKKIALYNGAAASRAAYELDVFSDFGPPAEITTLKTDIDDVFVDFTFKNPLDADFSHVNVYRDGVKIGTTTNEGFLDSNVIQNTNYVYTFTTEDTDGNESSGVTRKVKTLVEYIRMTPPNALQFPHIILDGTKQTVETSFDAPLEVFYPGYNTWTLTVRANRFTTGADRLPYGSLVLNKPTINQPNSLVSESFPWNIDISTSAITVLSVGTRMGTPDYTLTFPTNALELTVDTSKPIKPGVYTSSVSWTVQLGP